MKIKRNEPVHLKDYSFVKIKNCQMERDALAKSNTIFNAQFKNKIENKNTFLEFI